MALLMLLLVSLSGCLGPKPTLKEYKATPPQPGSEDPFRVEGVIANDSAGAAGSRQ